MKRNYNVFQAKNLKNFDGNIYLFSDSHQKIAIQNISKILKRYNLKHEISKILKNDLNSIENGDMVFITGDYEFIKKASKELKKRDGILFDCLENWTQSEIKTETLLALGYRDYEDISCNRILISEKTPEKITIRRVFHDGNIISRNNTVRLGSITYVADNCLISLFGNKSYVRIADKVTIRTLEIQVSTKGKVFIDTDVMMARSIKILQTSQHLIFDLDTKLRINQSKDVYVGKHVWLGWESMLLGGTHIPNNCILGARSITSSVFKHANCIIAGSPAKIIRRNIIWSRDSARHDHQHFDDCKDQAALQYVES